jgi:hypothetical protein
VSAGLAISSRSSVAVCATGKITGEHNDRIASEPATEKH